MWSASRGRRIRGQTSIRMCLAPRLTCLVRFGHGPRFFAVAFSVIFLAAVLLVPLSRFSSPRRLGWSMFPSLIPFARATKATSAQLRKVVQVSEDLPRTGFLGIPMDHRDSPRGREGQERGGEETCGASGDACVDLSCTIPEGFCQLRNRPRCRLLRPSRLEGRDRRKPAPNERGRWRRHTPGWRWGSTPAEACVRPKRQFQQQHQGCEEPYDIFRRGDRDAGHGVSAMTG